MILLLSQYRMSTPTKIEEDDIEEEQQITLTFDLPLSNNKISNEEKDDVIEHKLEDEEVKKIPVKDYIELITVTESNEKGDIRYALDDYIEVESSMNKKQPKTKEEIMEVLTKKLYLKRK